VRVAKPEQQPQEPRPDARTGCALHHHHVEPAIRGRGFRREAQEPAVRFHIGHGRDHGVPGEQPSVGLDANRRQRHVEEDLPGHAVVGEMAPAPLTGLARTVLHRLLHVREEAVAGVTEEHLAARDARVHRPHRPVLERIERGVGLHRHLEGGGEEIAEAGGHRKERHAVAHRRGGRRALRRVAADGDEAREVPGAGGAPRGEIAQALEGPYAHALAAPPELARYPARERGRATFSRARRVDDLDRSGRDRRHRRRSTQCRHALEYCKSVTSGTALELRE